MRFHLPLGNSGEENTWFRSGKNAALLPTSFGTQISQSLTPKGEGHFSLQFGDDETNNNKNNFARSAYINKKSLLQQLKTITKSSNQENLIFKTI